MKYKSIDLDLWAPEIKIPAEHRLPETKNIRIMHSAALGKGSRDLNNKNIKGSPFIIRAIERLIAEGLPIEYMYVTNKHCSQMRFYQAQADVLVEQLIYGWWGSTFVEASALGKPVVCYLKPLWKTFFFKTFPQYQTLPVIEADIDSIYDALKNLVIDAEYRRQKGVESRQFAEKHFNPEENTKAFIKVLEDL
jgi:glycosyltransferase involved in cell wall biosynthesis